MKNSDYRTPRHRCADSRSVIVGDVVAAVSKAGGFGVLGAIAHSPAALEVDLRWIEDEIGDKPYGVDLIVPAKYAATAMAG
ncbi:MAG: nitronate monooxygenase [Acidimicrobiales bacterium]